MMTLLKVLGLAALALTLVPPILFATGSMSEGLMKALLLVATVLWFATAPFFLKGGGG
jgi:hypothetical protein